VDPLTPDPKRYNVPFSTETFNGMPYRTLGPSGLEVSNIGLGTWKFGYPESGDGSRVDPATAMRIFDRAVELGVTFWDTANRYNSASGNSERLIGQWLKSNPDQRRNIVLATKVYGGMDGITPNHSGASRGNILDSVDACLRRLQLDYVDLLYLHRFDPQTPVEETLSTIEDLVRKDRVRYFAVSNFSVDQLMVYRAAEREYSVRSRILAVQNRFDMLGGEAEDKPGVLDFCAKNGISLVPYSPLARGLLTERYLDPTKAGPGDRLVDEGLLQKFATEEKLGKMRMLATLAKHWELELSQLALAYTLTRPGMGPLIPSSSSEAQVESNAHAGKVTLSVDQLNEIHTILSEND